MTDKKDVSTLLAKKKKVKPRKSRDADCCSVNFLKCVLHIFNIVFLFAGIAVLSVGVWTMMSRHRYVALLPTLTYPVISYLLVAAGGAAVPLSMLGCCGLKTENRTSLLCYTYSLLLVFLLECGAGVVSLQYGGSVPSSLSTQLEPTLLANYALDEPSTRAIDTMHAEFKCCGANQYLDWRRSPWHDLDPRQLVPDSCCKTITSGCGTRDHPSNIYYEGCLGKFTNHILEHLVILTAVGIGMSVIPIFGFVFSCVLYVKIKHVID